MVINLFGCLPTNNPARFVGLVSTGQIQETFGVGAATKCFRMLKYYSLESLGDRTPKSNVFSLDLVISL